MLHTGGQKSSCRSTTINAGLKSPVISMACKVMEIGELVPPLLDLAVVPAIFWVMGTRR